MRFHDRLSPAVILLVGVLGMSAFTGGSAAHAEARSPGRAEGNVSYETGKFGLGIRIDGPGERVVYPTAGILDPDEGTVELWVKTLAPTIDTPGLSAFFTVYYGPFNAGPPTEQAMMLFLKNDRDDQGRLRDQIALLLNGINGDTTDSFKPLGWGAGEWHHLAAVWGDGRPELYVDGKPSDDSWVVDTAQWVAGLFASNTLARVGAEFSLGTHDYQGLRHQYFPGVYDELRVTKRARTDEEIKASFSATSPLGADADTTLLDHFEADPPAPLRIVSDRGFNRFAPGEDVTLRVQAGRLPEGGVGGTVSLVTTLEGDSSKDKVLRVARPSGPALEDTTLRLGPFAREGVWPIRASMSQDGMTLTKGQSSVWIAPPIRAAAAASPFGETGVYNLRQLDDAFFADLSEMGGRWSRIPLGWGQIERTKGTYDWDGFDKVLARAERYGVELVPTLVWTSNKSDFFLGIPCWAGSHAVGPPSDWADFYRFAGAAAARYKGRVHYWSVWNEPNLDHHWGGDADAARKVSIEFARKNPRRFADMIRQDDATVSALVGMAAAAFQNGDVAGSRDLNQVIAYARQTTDAWNNYAFLCRETRRFDESARAYEEALNIEPDDPQLLNDCAVIYQYNLRSEENLAKAREYYDRAIKVAEQRLAKGDLQGAELDRTETALRDARNNLRAMR
ncbi:MAG: tetratricopeptide repeat protein [Myxococcales bacterium]|nr:tetratricopeptide repeat protein [Myxococcales bacterium]